jgi:hypothetical protein
MQCCETGSASKSKFMSCGGSKIEPLRAVEARNGGVEAQNGATDGCGSSQRRHGGSKRSLGGSLDQWSLISITLIRSRIQLRIHNKVKSRIQISITVIRGVQVHIKVMGIHKTDFRSRLPLLLIRIWPKRLLMTTYITELACSRVFCQMFFFFFFFLSCVFYCTRKSGRTRKRICVNKVKWSSYAIFEIFF